MTTTVAELPIVTASGDSAAAAAYEQLRRMIVTLALPPGSALTEPSLVHRIGIGRTPVREALRRLADERLVVIFPRRGMIVAHLGLTEIQQMFEARLLVEGELAKLAAERATAEEVARLNQINDVVHAARDAASFSAFLMADQQLHRAISGCGRNVHLADCAGRLLTLSDWLWHAQMARYGIQASDYGSHDPIVAAITRRDPEGARAAMIAHIVWSRELLRVTL
jgi:DNA-binding GntR family transcriptional regulator